MIKFTQVLFVFFFLSKGFAQSNTPTIIIHANDAIIWHPEQEITGEISGSSAESLIVHHNNDTFPVKVNSSGEFSFDRILRETENKIWIEEPGKREIVSDTLDLKMGYEPEPIIMPSATIRNGEATLITEVIENPYNLPLQYYWRADGKNPAKSMIRNKENATATVEIPEAIGTYFYEVGVIAEEDTTWYRTQIIREKDSVYNFDVEKSYPTWMDDAVIYQITPASFVKNGTFEDITAKLGEIKELGINTIWLQPIFGTHSGGQGYDIINYMGLNPKFGNEEQLKELISKAKDLDMRVLFDIVLNHSSINHPYAKDRIKNGKESHYYDFYQHEDDGKPYSSFYTKDKHGFINYFWDDLVNLNYNNKEVRRWMLEAAKYWVREFDIDGYRLDAIWGLNSRNPSFAKRLRTELKSIKPDLLLLAEDKGSLPGVYELGFDAAYDWTVDTTWVSQWSWEYEYNESESKTIFNHPDVDKRGALMRKALFHSGGNNHRKLYYLENNDLPGFIRDHGLRRTEMASALLFSLPGIPMLYNGQEIGHSGHPYSTSAFFKRDSTIRSLDRQGLFVNYKKLINLHKQYPALKGASMSPLFVSPEEYMVSYHRWEKDENFIIAVNLSYMPVDATIGFNDALSNINRGEDRVLKDVLTGHTFDLEKGASGVKIPMEGFSVRWLLVREE